MGKINILEPSVFNMIAAGEVVSRPASVVKELVENSIDAGATSIDVLIENGGKTLIKVSDNGAGILPEDMRNAFMPHATSKIGTISDLDTISTLGFRGEALASIASVSEVTLISKARGRDYASKISLSGGKITEECRASRAEGTIISVENLFFNTPARAKFLKKESAEEHAITDTVKSLILANPEIAITLAKDDEIVLSHSGGSLADAVYSVFGAEIADNLLEADYFSPSGIKVNGFVSSSEFSKPNRTYQTIIVNGRSVEDQTVTTAAEKPYSDYLMKRNYPVFIMNIVMPFDDLDVNVHPSKTEVRFRDKQAVFGAVYRAVDNALKSEFIAPESDADLTRNSTARGSDVRSPYSQLRLDTAFGPVKTQPKSFTDPYNWSAGSGAGLIRETQTSVKEKSENYAAKRPYSSENTSDRGIYRMLDGHRSRELTADYNDSDNRSDDLSFVEDADFGIAGKDFAHSFDENYIPSFDGLIIGQAFGTYLLVERDDRLYIIDQHAAHERILYERFSENLQPEYAQTLLIPYKFKLTGAEAEYFDKILPSLRNMGFDAEFNSGNYFIYAVPEPFSKMDFKKFLSGLFQNMFDEQDICAKTLLKDFVCMQACKAAIKGGERLSKDQIEAVIRSFTHENCKLPEKCPHGRPAVVTVDKRELEKLFKRIV